MKSDETFVIGVNANKEIEFLKSYHYDREKGQAQADLTQVQEKYPCWYISSFSQWKMVSSEGEEFTFKIKEKI